MYANEREKVMLFAPAFILDFRVRLWSNPTLFQSKDSPEYIHIETDAKKTGEPKIILC